jgi:hypothetical protein
MKAILKTILTTVFFAATASAAFAESYEVNSVAGTQKLAISVQGAGVTKIPSPALNNLLPEGGIVGQQLSLKADHTMTGAINYFDGVSTTIDLFSLTGMWYRPPGSSTIYFALDGDPTQGPASTGAYGALFDPGKALLMALPNFMPVLFQTKISSISPIYPTVKLKTGIIKLKLSGDQIKSASTSLVLTGRGMVQYCKYNKNTEDCVATGAPKDATFGFSTYNKSTVVPGM